MLDLPLEQNLSLYLHIPFCTTCCSYCAFYSEPKASWRPYQDAYVERLALEIQQLTQRVGTFSTIFVGGGNPGSLSVTQLHKLLSLAQIQGKSTEVTLEMNPETFTEAYFPLFAEGLVTRLSMGIQSMDDRMLKNLGRNARKTDNLKGMALACKARSQYGIDLSFDLMTCLPGQSESMALDDLGQMLAIGSPDHLSVYCLTIEEGTELSRQVGLNQTAVLDDDQQAIILTQIWEYLASQGYDQYEVSNFCKPGKACKHNLVYWHLNSYVGLGSSAASTLIGPQESYHYQQTQDLRTFSAMPVFSGYDKELLSTEQCMEEFVMMSLRLSKGIEKASFANRFHGDFDTRFHHAIQTLHPAWYFSDANHFHVTTEGMLLLDEIILRLVMQIPQPLDRPYSL